MYDLASYSTSNPLEDFLTEVIAPVFKDEEILTSFLSKFTGKQEENISNIRVSTQKTYRKILDHSTDSRPDLVVTFETAKRRHIIFFESKFGSSEGVQQLKRYYDHLIQHSLKGYATHLFYVTREYDPKETRSATHQGTMFSQMQWFQIYNWLITFKENLYVNEVLKYMEVYELNKSRVFSPSDIHALQNLYKLQTMLDETLNGKLKLAFEEFFGRSMQWQNRAKQLRERNRYVLSNDQSDWKYIGCGFWFTEEEYPDITVFLEVSSNCQRKEEVLKAIDTFCLEHPEWEFEGPEDERDGFILYIDKSLLMFLSESDHIDSIQEYIIGKLEELHTLKTQFPELKWEARGKDS